MKDIVLSIVIILALLLGIPILVLVIRDRSKKFGGFINGMLGGITLLIGVSMFIWVIYALITGDEAFTLKRSILGYLGGIAVAIALTATGWKWLTDSGPGIDEQDIDFDSPELQRSVSRARSTLPYFIGRVSAHIDGAYIKFPFVTDTQVTEHVWAYVHHYNDGLFNVSIANEPYTQEGDFEVRRDVPDKDVEDWQIMYDDGNIKGAYSYIGAFEYLARKNIRLNRTMRKQLAQLVDADRFKAD